MTANRTATASVGTGPAFLLFLAFLVMKLTGVIAWSWWWVTAPLWGPFAFIMAFVLIGTIIALFAGGSNRKRRRRRR